MAVDSLTLLVEETLKMGPNCDEDQQMMSSTLNQRAPGDEMPHGEVEAMIGFPSLHAGNRCGLNDQLGRLTLKLFKTSDQPPRP